MLHLTFNDVLVMEDDEAVTDEIGRRLAVVVKYICAVLATSKRG